MAHPDPMEMVQSKDSIRSIALRPMLIWYDQTEKKSRIKEVKHITIQQWYMWVMHLHYLDSRPNSVLSAN